MSIRTVIFLLILYLAFAWIIVGLEYQQDGVGAIVQNGLIWTAVGLAAVILLLIAEQLVKWLRGRRAQAKAEPAVRTAIPARVHEDDAAFAAVLDEADTKLAQAPDVQRRRIRDYPIYLLVGLDGAGKTSLINNSGIDARLLAGQVQGTGSSVTATRIANVWLANEAIFIEISGRVFQSDPTRFGEFLSVLRLPNAAKGLRSLWSPAATMLQLQGVILCWDLRGFVSSQDRATIERSAAMVRDRLLRMAQVFSMRVPVYTVFTKTDAIPFFAEFFARMPESEAAEPLGTLQTAVNGNKTENAVWAEAQTQKLTQEFNALFNCLSSRRILVLNKEPVAELKPAIYEFPREFKRVRAPVVQFLVDSLRPDPLSVNPVLRGFFFTGSRLVEASADIAAQAATTTFATGRASGEVTQIFRADVTQMIAGLGDIRKRGNLVERPTFTRDFFQVVLRKDRPPIQVVAIKDPRESRRRTIALGAVGAVAATLVVLWTVSWYRNRELVQQVATNVGASGKKIHDLSRESLEALDSLRQTLVTRLDQPRPLSMNWGLYTGDELREGVRHAYFGRLRQIFMSDANRYLIGDLAKLDSGAKQPVAYETAYNRLKTQITIAQSGCAVDAPLVSGTLRQVAAEMHQDLDESRKELVGRQIDYYVAALSQSNPMNLPTDPDTVDHARKYLSGSRGPQQVYAAIVAEVRKAAPRIYVRDRVADFKKAMSAPEEVTFEFTNTGRDKFEALADSGKFSLQGESCVLGSNGIARGVASNEQIQQAKSIYYGRYKDAWEKFLSQTHVLKYQNLADAITKLNFLSSPTSPLLGLVKFVGENTYFPAQKPVADVSIGGQLKGKLGLDKAKAKAQAAAEKAGLTTKPAVSSADLNRVFQPVHVTVAPDTQNLVTDKNKAYVDGLRKLVESLDKYQNASTAERAPLMPQIQDAFLQANAAQRGLADAFNQDTENVNERVAAILLEPIRNADGFIDTNLPRTQMRERNAKLAQVCKDLGPVFRKYPFNVRSDDDLSLADFTRAFAPESGLVWKWESQAMADLLVKNAANHWEQKADAKPQVAPELLEFLNRLQAMSDVFFRGGAPHLQYSLRPVPQQSAKIVLDIDGVTMNAKDSAFRKEFEWPGSGSGAVGNVVVGDSDFKAGFGQYPGTWGVFRLFQNAEDRQVGEKTVTWTRTSGMHAVPQPMTPVKVEFVQFPGGADVFNPRFFDRFKCPSQAVLPE